MTLAEYTVAAERLISSFRIPLTDEMVGEVVKTMIETDNTELDNTKSNMTKHQFRRQQAIYTIRRCLHKEKNKKKTFDIQQIPIAGKEFINVEVSGFERRMVNQASRFFYNEKSLDETDKKCVYMLLDGHVIRDISETLQIPLSSVVRSIKKSAKVYHDVRGGVT